MRNYNRCDYEELGREMTVALQGICSLSWSVQGKSLELIVRALNVHALLPTAGKRLRRSAREQQLCCRQVYLP
jgi:hypothetical protein